MRLPDPTFPSRPTENFQAIRKGLLALGPVIRTLTATSTLNFPSISAQTQSELTVAVDGAQVGDAVSIGSPSGLESGLSVTGYVSSLGVVTVRVVNSTSGAVNPASATWRVVVQGYG